MSDSNVNEQIHEFLEEAKKSLLQLTKSIDGWFECLKRLAKFLNSDVPLDKYQAFIKNIEKKIQELYDDIVYYENQIDKAICKSMLAKLMDLENLWGDLVVQTDYVGKSAKNVAEGCIPQNTKLNIPTSWRETKTLVGKGSYTF